MVHKWLSTCNLYEYILQYNRSPVTYTQSTIQFNIESTSGVLFIKMYTGRRVKMTDTNALFPNFNLAYPHNFPFCIEAQVKLCNLLEHVKN